MPEDNDKRQTVTNGAAGLGCVSTIIFYFFVGVNSYWIHLNDLNGYGPTPPSLEFGTKPYWPIPPVVLGLVWLGLRRRYPDAAKGIRFALFVSAALSLGALAICR